MDCGTMGNGIGRAKANNIQAVKGAGGITAVSDGRGNRNRGGWVAGRAVRHRAAGRNPGKYVNSIESQEVINKGERSITYLKKQVEILQAANRQCRRHNIICHVIIGVFLFFFGVLLAWDLMYPQYGFINRARSGISPSGGTWYKHILGIISHKMR